MIKKFDEFKEWFFKEEYTATYIHKNLTDLKRFCKEVKSRGIEVSIDLVNVRNCQEIKCTDPIPRSRQVVIFNPIDIGLRGSPRLLRGRSMGLA